jgi:hypothetical protein
MQKKIFLRAFSDTAEMYINSGDTVQLIAVLQDVGAEALIDAIFM